MAVKIRTVVTYNLDGATTTFTIPFEYLARKFVTVTLIGQDRKELVLNQDYRFSSKTQITTTLTWGASSGYQLLEIRRFTSATERLVDFSDGSILRAYDLNISQVQTLHVAEEARDLTADTIGVNNDGHLDARGRRIVNLADPVEPLDAVNLRTIKSWNDGAYQSYIKAKEEAEKALLSASAARNSEVNSHNSMRAAEAAERGAKQSETVAAGYKDSASTSAQSASQSAALSSTSAQEAVGAKEYTKQQADRAYGEAERAKGYADAMGNTIDIGKVISDMDTTTNQVIWKGGHTFGDNVITKGLNLQVRPSGKNGFAAEIGVNESSSTPHLAWRKDSSSSWNLMYIPEGNSTLVSKSYLNTIVDRNSDDSNKFMPPNGNHAFIVTNSGSMRLYSTTIGEDTINVSASGDTILRGRLIVGKGDYSNIALRRSNGTRTDLEATPEGADSMLNIIQRDSSGSNQRLISVPRDNGMLATREWASAQNFGTRLSGIVRGAAVRIEDTDSKVHAAWLAAAFDQVPDGAIFCGFDKTNVGSYIGFIPKWRTIQ